MDSSSVCFFPGSSGVYSAGRVVNTQPSIVAYQHAYLVGAIAGRSLRARAKAREQLTHSACIHVRTLLFGGNACFFGLEHGMFASDEVATVFTGNTGGTGSWSSSEGSLEFTREPAPVSSLAIKKHVMCLMSDTGGGHRASAQALKDGDSFAIHVVDLWSSSSPWPLCNMPKSYFFLVKNPWLWRLSFRCSEPEILHEALFTGYTALVGRRFAKAFHENEPTTQLVAAQAMSYGLVANQLACHGLPIRPAFNAESLPKVELRRLLQLDLTASTVMLVGGGEGMGKLEATAEALSQTSVICGRNEKLARTLAARTWPLKMVIKARFIPCQEEGNVSFVLENGVGAFSEDPVEISQIISRWFKSDGIELNSMSSKAKSLGRPEATFNIVRDLAGE
eukprot:30897-Pelagococcus_subviridis.AAC.14